MLKAYEDGGEQVLGDKGRSKTSEEELSPGEKTKLEMKKLKGENGRLRAENQFLK